MKEYAIYKGEVLLAMGTKEECAKALSVKPETIYYYTTDAYQRKLENRKHPTLCRIGILLED